MKNKGFDHSSLTDRTLPLLFSIVMQRYQIQVFDESYNDFIAKVIVTSH